MIAPIIFIAGLVLALIGVAIRVRETTRSPVDGKITLWNNRGTIQPKLDEPKPWDWRLARDIATGQVVVEQLKLETTTFEDFQAAQDYVAENMKAGQTICYDGIFTGDTSAKPEGGK